MVLHVFHDISNLRNRKTVHHKFHNTVRSTFYSTALLLHENFISFPSFLRRRARDVMKIDLIYLIFSARVESVKLTFNLLIPV